MENPKRYLEISKVSTVTFDELIQKYKENFKNQRCYRTSKKFSIEMLERDFSGRLLGSINYYDLEAYRNKLLNTPTKNKGFRKPASVNRAMACFRHILTKAVEWDMLDRNPFERGRSLQLKENNKRMEVNIFEGSMIST